MNREPEMERRRQRNLRFAELFQVMTALSVVNLRKKPKEKTGNMMVKLLLVQEED